MNWTKYSGYFLAATGVFHNIIGVILTWPFLVDMHHSGWWATTMVDNQILFEREATLWFITVGFFWILFGLTLQKILDQGVKLPEMLGWGFILIAILLIIIIPISGAYLFLLQGVLILMAAKSSSVTCVTNE